MKPIRLQSRAAAIALLLVALAGTHDTRAYLKTGTMVDGQSVPARWQQMPVEYEVSEAGVDGVSAGQLRDAVGAAFSSWQAVTTASVRAAFGGFTSASPLDEDGLSTMGFVPRPDMERTLAATSYLVDTETGAIVESDVFFNAAFAWSVAPAGEPGRYDLQSIALHEAGHVLGLGHSALGETATSGGGRRLVAAASAMFPVAFAPGSILGRTLWPDDVAGISDEYPAAGSSSATGSVQGTVTKNGHGVFGAHVVAFSLASGAMVGGFTLDDGGHFVIGGLPPGTYLLRVEPLDDGDVSSYLDSGDVDTDFGVTFAPELATVPAGGSSAAISIAVRAK